MKDGGKSGTIRVGIGGWSYPPWRGPFYPVGLPHAGELGFASARLTAIEINATFHRTQKPESFRNWREATPPGFVFAVKGPRGASYLRDPAAAHPAVARFLDSGVLELREKLGPILWQIASASAFDPARAEAFVASLPRTHGGTALRHAVEATHASFDDPAFAALLERHGVVRALVDSDGAAASEPSGGFVYARLKRNSAEAPDGYPSQALTAWEQRVRVWSSGGGRDCFVFFIGGDKVRAPDAAQAFLHALRTDDA